MPKTVETYELPGTQQARPSDSIEYFELRPELYVMERKFDGFRLLAEMMPDGELEGYSRAHRVIGKYHEGMSEMLPHVHRSLRRILWDVNGIRGYTVLDGELYVAPDGVPHTQSHSHVASVMKSLAPRARELQGIDRHGNTVESLFGSRARPLVYYAFDVLYYNGADMRSYPWSTRRNRLEEILGAHDDLTASHNHQRDPDVRLSLAGPPSQSQLDKWFEDGDEGAIIKRVDRPYHSFDRPKDNWYKMKVEETADVVCMGFTDGRPGKGVRRMTDTIGAICFGQYVDGVLTYRGNASGMDDDLRFDQILDKSRGIDNRKDFEGRVFEIRHNGIQNPGFRHPRFLWWRDDKKAEECTWD